MSVHRDEEELLRLLLDREAGAEAARTAELLEARNDPAVAPVLARFDGILGRARTLDRRAEWAPAREKALVKRILSTTTRQDLRWRGDLQLAVEFVGQRLRSSPALRAMAATIVGLMFVTSVFAWLAVREHQEWTGQFKMGGADGESLFEIDDAVLGEGESAELVLPEVGELTDAERRAWQIENCVRRDRFLLDQWEAAVVVVTDDQPLTVRLLAARAAWLQASEWPEWIETEATLEAALGLDRVLFAELLLDRFAGTGTPSPLLPRTLHRLSREALAGAGEDPLVALGQRALERARAYGRWEPEDEASAAGFAPRPLDDEWYALLARALPAELRGHPALAPWLR